MADKPKAPVSTSFPVRISTDDHQWLAALAKENGVEISQIIRWAVMAFRQHVEAHDGKLHLPINITSYYVDLLENRDPMVETKGTVALTKSQAALLRAAIAQGQFPPFYKEMSEFAKTDGDKPRTP